MDAKKLPVNRKTNNADEFKSQRAAVTLFWFVFMNSIGQYIMLCGLRESLLCNLNGQENA